MRLTKEQLHDKLQRNKQISVDIKASILSRPTRDSGPVAVMEPASGDEPLAEAQIQETDSERFSVRVCSIRQRLLDEDNLAEKYCVDLCRYFAYIPDDKPATTHIEVSQRKCAQGEPEHVEIIIGYL